MATNIGTLAASITLNATQFMGASKSVQSEASALAGKVTGVFAALAVPVTAFGFFEWMKSGLKDIKEMDTEARKMGININELGGFMRLAGGDGEGFVKGIGNMRKMLGEASLGSEEASHAFKQIGLNVKDLKGLDTGSIFGKIADKLNNMSDATEAAAAGSKIFNRRNYQSMIYGIEQGSRGVAEAIEKNKKIAGVFSPQDIANTRAALRSLKDVDESITAIQRHLAVTSAPFIKMLADAFQEFIPNSDALNDALTVAARIAAGFTTELLSDIRDIKDAWSGLNASVDDFMEIWRTLRSIGHFTPSGFVYDNLRDLIFGGTETRGTGVVGTKLDDAINRLRDFSNFGTIPGINVKGGPGREGEANQRGLDMTNELIEKLELEAIKIRMTADEFERYKVRVTEASAVMSKSMAQNLEDIQKVQDKVASNKLKEDLISPWEKFQKEIRRIDDLFAKNFLGKDEDLVRGKGILGALQALESANGLQSGRSPEIAIAGSKEAFNAIRDNAEQSKDPLQRIAEATAAGKALQESMRDYLREIAKAPLYLRKSDLSKGD